MNVVRKDLAQFNRKTFFSPFLKSWKTTKCSFSSLKRAGRERTIEKDRESVVISEKLFERKALAKYSSKSSSFVNKEELLRYSLIAFGLARASLGGYCILFPLDAHIGLGMGDITGNEVAQFSMRLCGARDFVLGYALSITSLKKYRDETVRTVLWMGLACDLIDIWAGTVGWNNFSETMRLGILATAGSASVGAMSLVLQRTVKSK